MNFELNSSFREESCAKFSDFIYNKVNSVEKSLT